ncbi:MAG: hypothetical protein K8T89_13955 [Planctomycetes bacterium]|nr:hypothetical protein [Planctomycetota bacterium]
MTDANLEPVILPFPSMRVRTDLTFQEARDLLDWLDAHGISARVVDVTDEGDVTVRWEEPLAA